jgi:hypothetical protein
VTEHEYDEATGRLLRSVARREPEFDDEDRSWFLGLSMCRQLTCQSCGGWLPDTTKHDASHYRADPAPYACGACVALGTVQRAYAQDYPNDMHATRWAIPEVRGHG